MNPVICYLSKSDAKTVKQLKASLRLLHKNFNKQFNFPIRIFVERDFSHDVIRQLTDLYPTLSFIEIELECPLGYIPKSLDGLNYHVGYKHMCQFFHSEFYKHLPEYDWYLRLDSDSFIIDKINTNLFQHLKDTGKVYGYVAELPEWPPAVKHLDTWFEEFTNRHGIKTKLYNEIIQNGVYGYRQIYNNFEIISKEYFTNDKVNFLIDALTSSGNIYHWRWGDAPLRTLILSLCYDKSKLCRFGDIGYHHVFFHQKRSIRRTSLTGEMKNLFDNWNKNSDWIV
jgi:hypothetical protein